MAITGNPGIGKSVFLFYILWRLATNSNADAVILRRQKDDNQIYIFQKGSAWMTRDDNRIMKLLYSPRTWYLTDTLEPTPGEVKAMTVLVASPARKHYKELLKYSATAPLHYLPVWALEELLSAREQFSLSKELVELRYCQIGGIPRFVLEKQDDLVITIENAIGRLQIEKFDRIESGALEKDDEISHMIVHFEPDHSYKRASLRMGSSYITEKALERFAQSQKDTLKTFLSNLQPTTLLVEGISSCDRWMST